MNASKRTKYSSTPTYGMQKRGFLKKTASFSQTNSVPDFTQVPVPDISIPSVSPTFFQSAASAPAYALPYQVTQFPQGMQPFTGVPLPTQDAPFGIPSALPYSHMQGHPSPPGYTFPTHMPTGVPRPSLQQPFVPQTTSFQSGVDGMKRNTVIPATVQSSQSVGTYIQQNVAPVSNFTQSQAHNMPFSLVHATIGDIAPGIRTTSTGEISQMPVMQQHNFQSGTQQISSPPSKPVERANSNKLLALLLFGLLPLLFIGCLFAPSVWNSLRYLFIAMCIAGLGLMWYNRLFASTTRATVSILYTALCIAIIFMLFTGNGDPRAANTSSAADTQVSQADMEPNVDSYSAGMITETPPQETPAPAISIGESAAEQRLISFMEYWKNSLYESMITLVQPSWTSVHENAVEDLFQILANRTPLEYELEGITGSELDNTRNITMSAYIDKNNLKEATRYRYTIVMVKEANDWYVDPKTLATNDVLTTTEETTVSGPTLAPAPPRTTVTPVPAPNALLYYNGNGGKKYHADPNCSSIKAEYLPLSDSFPYSELASVQSGQGLEPCLKCDAPINAADTQ